MIDSELINLIKEGDSKGLDILVNEYGKLCYGVIASVLLPNGMNEYVDECFNDVLVTFWFKIEMFESRKGKLRNWLISICKYRALDYLRKKKNESDINSEVTKDKESVEESVMKEEEKRELKKAIENLSYPDSEIFKMRYLEDRDIDYIASVLNISKGTVYTRISRGKIRLKEMMEGYYE
ncbi:sigma-70 family RNA polymerase sigma factor [Clostridium chrysemydis]|uniref:sigma-70 family RNA polymerase sigma factor n=1 Tax=Clostridium chrysemydis TaxID=2665504 RepID=UPI0018841851|nr:sigma-70 family RNA polymerase sigma factor [Clostridium chrysemydis]